MFSTHWKWQHLSLFENWLKNNTWPNFGLFDQNVGGISSSTGTSKRNKFSPSRGMCCYRWNIFSLNDNIPHNQILAPFYQKTSLDNGRKQNSKNSVPWLLAEWQWSFPKHLLGLSVLSEWVCELWEQHPLYLKEQGFSQHQSLVNNQPPQSQSSGVSYYSGGTEQKGKLKKKKVFSHLGSFKTNAL